MLFLQRWRLHSGKQCKLQGSRYKIYLQTWDISQRHSVFLHLHSLKPLQFSSGPTVVWILLQLKSGLPAPAWRLLTALYRAGGLCGRCCGPCERSQASWPGGHEWRWQAGFAGLRGRWTCRRSADLLWGLGLWSGCRDGTGCRCSSCRPAWWLIWHLGKI